MDKDETHDVGYHDYLHEQDKFECDCCKEVFNLAYLCKTGYEEVICDDCSDLCEGCWEYHRLDDLENVEGRDLCPECREVYTGEIPERIQPYEN